MTENKNPKVGVFHSDRKLELIPADNGGWVIEQGGKRLGAYTNSTDMIDALKEALP